jgi:predicted nucleic acid-binding protein
VLFADTYFFIARLWPRDPLHTRAVAWEQYVLRHGLTLLTTEAVLWELLNAFCSHVTRRQAIRAYNAIHAEPAIDTLDFEPNAMQAALNLYESHDDKDWGITDCLSFVSMRARGLTEALTADHHFVQAGFDALLLRPPP